jgi:hypothetical protein
MKRKPRKRIDNPSQLVSAPWFYTGDGDLAAGGLFCKLDNLRYGYAECVEVTDLASASGADRMALIEKGTINFDFRRVRKAVESCGWLPLSKDRRAKVSRENRKLMLLEAVKSYYGMEVDASEVVQGDPSYGMVSREGWKAEKVVDDRDLPGYVAAKFID